eukprot:12674397-Alexandrium_andersonii.AAC.1
MRRVGTTRAWGAAPSSPRTAASPGDGVDVRRDGVGGPAAAICARSRRRKGLDRRERNCPGGRGA